MKNFGFGISGWGFRLIGEQTGEFDVQFGRNPQSEIRNPKFVFLTNKCLVK
jgi:hypothetical protein